MKGRSNRERWGRSKEPSGRGGGARGDGSGWNMIGKEKGGSGDLRVRVGETEEAGVERGRVTRRGAPLPSRLPGQGPRPGRGAGPGRRSSFRCCDPGVRPAPPLTTMEAEAEAAAEAATAAAAAHRIRIRSQTGLIRTGLLLQRLFFLLHARSPLRLRRLVQDRWFSAVRPETSASFRPERVGGNTQAAPGPPAPPRPAPPVQPRLQRRSPRRGQFGACPARDPVSPWPVPAAARRERPGAAAGGVRWTWETVR